MDFKKIQFLDDKILLKHVSKAIGETFREERKKKRISQHTVSDIANVNNSYYSLVENGEVNPSIYKYLMICGSLDLTPTQAISIIMEKLSRDIETEIDKDDNK